MEEDNIKLSGWKAVKKIPKHNRPLSEERGHTNSFTFDEAWEKEVTVTKAGKKNQIKW